MNRIEGNSNVRKVWNCILAKRSQLKIGCVCVCVNTSFYFSSVCKIISIFCFCCCCSCVCNPMENLKWLLHQHFLFHSFKIRLWMSMPLPPPSSPFTTKQKHKIQNISKHCSKHRHRVFPNDEENFCTKRHQKRNHKWSFRPFFYSIFILCVSYCVCVSTLLVLHTKSV